MDQVIWSCLIFILEYEMKLLDVSAYFCSDCRTELSLFPLLLLLWEGAACMRRNLSVYVELVGSGCAAVRSLGIVLPIMCRCLRWASIDITKKGVWSWSINSVPMNLNNWHKDITLESICTQATIKSRMRAMTWLKWSMCLWYYCEQSQSWTLLHGFLRFELEEINCRWSVSHIPLLGSLWVIKSYLSMLSCFIQKIVLVGW